MTKDVKCPICGSETIIRTAVKGPNTGRKFHVCIRFPECKGGVPVEKIPMPAKKEELACQNCGAAISQSDKFCVHCGEKFTRQESATLQSAGYKETQDGERRISAMAKNNVRVRYTGKGIDILGRYILWSILVMFTLGIYSPWMINNLFKYVIEHVEVENVE